MMRAWIRKLLHIAPRWPQGTPFMAGDVRIGTILPDGSILLAPGFTFAPGSQASSGQQQIDQTAQNEKRAEAINSNSSEAICARVSGGDTALLPEAR